MAKRKKVKAMLFNASSNIFQLHRGVWFLSLTIVLSILLPFTASKYTFCNKAFLISIGGRRGRDRMVVGFTTTYMQSVPFTSKVVSSNPVHGEAYSIQYIT
jgi:hypothetical protein